MKLKCTGKRPHHLCGRGRPLQMEMLDGHARLFELPGQPAFAAGWKERHVGGAGRLQPRGELRHDPFCASRAVGFNQMCDAQPLARGKRHRHALTFCSPTASAISVYSISA